MRIALNIYDTAVRCGILQTFTRLLEGSALERELRGKNHYTLFAPADVSFAYLPQEVFAELLRADSQERLAHVLSYHAVRGKIMSSQLKDISRTKTVYGEYLIVNHSDELRIGGARLIETDIEACNGVIHVIDRLLLPARAASATT